MAATTANHCCPAVDPNTGFSFQMKTFHSLRPYVPLSPPSQPRSLPQYALSLFHNFSHASATVGGDTTFIVDAANGNTLSYSQFIAQIYSLAYSLKNFSLSQNDVAFILSPLSFHVPSLYFALMSLGIVVPPANPLGFESEITHQVQLSKPVIAFATSKTSSNINVSQHDTSTILYSSETTGRVKGVLLSHLSIIVLIAGYYHLRKTPQEHEESHPVSFFTVPLFHVFGFFLLARAFSIGETVVFTDRFEFEGMLRAVEKYKITFMPISSPLVVAFIKLELTKKYDLSSLMLLGSGGGLLGRGVHSVNRPEIALTELTDLS
ncbi:hypothetical protein Goshw_025984 [Gossypium schwendimanii]|uniref:AMP-dependent synthetase/ligase domain-containing protein n=1 Tax=Gossypium schwendimanii TaxID=34291 RepID=A0A7J9N4N4_GOSSC|nr:hypothetical protein [Gossypium schwendimanii]